MQKITIKKKWVEKLGQMTEQQREKCLMALFDYFVNDQVSAKTEEDADTHQFIDKVSKEHSRDKQRREVARERARLRREEQERREKQSKKSENEAEILGKWYYIDDPEEYEKCPNLYIFDGIMRYLLTEKGNGRVLMDFPSRELLIRALFRYRYYLLNTGWMKHFEGMAQYRDHFSVSGCWL